MKLLAPLLGGTLERLQVIDEMARLAAPTVVVCSLEATEVPAAVGRGRRTRSDTPPWRRS